MKDDKEEVSPDSLMGDFRGRGLITIVIVTVIAHVVVFGATSIGYIKSELLGPETGKMSQEEKIDNAVQEATLAIRDIAGKYELSPQDISDRFAQGGSRTNAVKASSNKTDDTQQAPTAKTPEPPADDTPKSAIEKQLETVAPPPAAPDLNAKEEEDLF